MSGVKVYVVKMVTVTQGGIDEVEKQSCNCYGCK
jgi:hypothetical protein